MALKNVWHAVVSGRRVRVKLHVQQLYQVKRVVIFSVIKPFDNEQKPRTSRVSNELKTHCRGRAIIRTARDFVLRCAFFSCPNDSGIVFATIRSPPPSVCDCEFLEREYSRNRRRFYSRSVLFSCIKHAIVKRFIFIVRDLFCFRVHRTRRTFDFINTTWDYVINARYRR